ncbi:Adenylate-forming reductase Nps11 [Colletotrichum sp. SAR 10_70]|nr:Adenylate-forming reductase Nps11 [Colletotrichum sp. SAR 10_70]KAI8165852.1 Adenylate-forming reductase Nps11 [Colletotrichum sp. SAR 10_71]KAI8183127.1 Adenylate-forming reductase Nps11 [Colletotrichum sp. SAR 10_75]KAJ4997685.1 Adenylate-forming reductase Nps11 [Colletotrichum sp. SAR 10_66]
MSPPSVYGPTSAELPGSSLAANPLAESTAAAAQGWDNDDSTIKTVDELVRRRARAHPDSVIVSYPSSGINYVDYTMRQLDVFAYRVAKFYEQRIPSRLNSEEKPTTVAVLGPSNFDYLITMLALTKLGHTTLFLSTRISQEAIESLITTTGAKFLIADKRYLETAEGTKQNLSYLDVFEIAGQSTFDFPIEVHADTQLDYGRDLSVETNNLIYIIHSSGSTGLPKPIYQTQKSAIANYSSSMDMKAFITLPLYHNHGICNLYRAIYSGKSIHLYNADLPLTREHLTGIMRKHNFEIFYGVPYALKLLAETDEGMALLRQLKIVMYGGSACPDDLGDTLVNNGVNLVGHYGATEVGQLMTSFRPPNDKVWNYVRVHDKLEPYLKWIPRGPNLFECCVLPGWPAKVATNQDDGSYCTKDLFEPHPTIPKAWKYIARLDDTIALVNGEKFNPVHMEGTIRSNKNITECVIFGVGRPSLGALIVPAPALAGKTDEAILEVVWPVVEEASRKAEAYARVSKNMIKLLPYDCAYPRTDKGSVIRQAFYKRYAQEIDEVYDKADASSGDLKKLSLPELKDFIRQGLVQALSKKVDLDDDTDFFSLGLDSLQAIQMRSDILRTIDIGGSKLGQTVVFDHPSINKLSAYLLGLGSGEGVATDVPIETEMSELIEKYDTFDAPKAAPRSSIAVTGATGSLGAHVVAKLAADPTIKTIYCFTRASSDADAARRVKSSLIQRRLYHTLPATSRRKLVALATDLADPKLGLSETAYGQVKQDLRTVIHCAWSVNFNMRLSSFEKGNIAGVNHLIALAKAAGDDASSTATFNFCSSVSTVARATTIPVPESVPDFEWAQGMGYAQSKCVAEHLCSRASAKSGVKARVLRIGQIVADTEHGVWNATEAIPLMLQTAITVGALPKLQETPSWLPVDTVAQAVIDISTSDADGVFTNVANPKMFSWTNDLLPALKAAGLEFEEVEPKEWIRRLRASNPDPAANPPIKLVDFFASKYDKDEFAPSKTYVTDTACSLSPALAEAPVLTQQLVSNFVEYFKANHWIQQAKNSSKTVIMVAGPCGSGKSTLATSLASELKVPFIEGDSLHSKAAVEKMGANLPLTDDDRASWLGRIGKRAVETIEDLGYDSVVVSCSALKKSYRDTLRDVVSKNEGARIVFLDIQCAAETLVKRMNERKGHYMLASMVEGQVGVYEPAGLEELDVFPVEGENKPEEVFEEAKWLLGQIGLN